MSVPEDFQFSQASLQDFVTCPRRFQLRYLMELAWPAVEVEPIEDQERRMELGLTFHHMVQQHILGLPAERLTRMAKDEDLRRWWQNYLTYRPIASFAGPPAEVDTYPETALVGEVAGYRLFAKYDLIVVTPDGRAVIFDWKTSSRRASEDELLNRMQTRVYRFLLVQAGQHLNGGVAPAADRVTMVYWFPEFPASPARLPYDLGRYEGDHAYLTRLVERIAAMEDDAFYLTDDVDRCLYCPFRSYCDRGVKPGDLDEVTATWEAEADDLGDLELDFEQISEIEF
ncbi:MAG: PD-(D/E)XK nuclease family protein [Anaerolineae bacterium]